MFHQLRSGFSLIELMVAVSLMLILTLNAVPAMDTMLKHNTVRSQANSLLALLQFTRSEAIKQQQTIQLTLSDTDEGWKADVTRVTDAQLLRSMSHDTLDILLTDDTTVLFDAKGRSAAQACITLSYTGHSDLDRHLSVSLGGQIAVEPGGCGV